MSVNESEERLADLTRQTFLSMWSYQNPFYEQGKELCDVLVVFGDDVVIISDKVIRYSEDKSQEVAWERWYRRAVLASVRQLQGALKTIQRTPEAIHLDAKVTSPFPLEFPDPKRARYHLIAVAHGAEAACTTHTGKPSFAVDPQLPADGQALFTVGAHFQSFVHVFNRTTLYALFECFDTAVDFVRYLCAKEDLFKHRHVWLAGEEDLIALYMDGRRPNGSAPLDDLLVRTTNGTCKMPSGLFDQLKAGPALAHRKSVLAPSYLVDNVIEQLAHEYMHGRILASPDNRLAYHANAFQILASESRMGRMLMAQGVMDILTEDPETFWSVVVESVDCPNVVYVWLVYPVVGVEVSDDQLEAVVGNELSDYVLVAMSKFPNAQRVFGIALPNSVDSRTSRVFRLFAREDWNDDLQREVEALGRAKGILSTVKTTKYVAMNAI